MFGVFVTVSGATHRITLSELTLDNAIATAQHLNTIDPGFGYFVAN